MENRVKKNVITGMGVSFTKWTMKYMPDASIFAVVLTLIAFLLGIILAKQTPLQMVVNWYRGFWGLLAFGMQMALIIVTGSCVAAAPAVKKIIQRLARWPKNGAQAAGSGAFRGPSPYNPR